MKTNRFSHTGTRKFGSLAMFVAGPILAMIIFGPPPILGTTSLAAQETKSRQCVVEFYFDSEQTDGPAEDAVLAAWMEGRSGVLLVARDVNRAENAQRIEAIASHYRMDKQALPIVYGCNRAFTRPDSDREFKARLDEMVRLEVFVRRGCSRCDRAKVFLRKIETAYPGFELVYHDLVTDRQAANDLNELVRRHRQAAASVPVVHSCNQLMIGWDRDETSGARLMKMLDVWTTPAKTDDDNESTPEQARSTGLSESEQVLARSAANAHAASRWDALQVRLIESMAWSSLTMTTSLQVGEEEDSEKKSESQDETAVPSLPIPGMSGSDIQGRPPPGEETGALPIFPGENLEDESETSYSVELPWFGTIDARQLGLPAFTLAVGLVDGFNPCAMWVLLFLLSLLVNLHSRSRMLAVAGSFVVISGVAYYLFMAAWLNVFLLVGLLRPVQIALGLIGVAIGAVHVKDYFAFKKGITLSIPERAKPGIYAQTRKILTAENLIAAIAGACVLAVMVNIVELLCTAGLPALYTQVLAAHELADWKNYLYLALYILAYMFDDSLMVGIVVITLSKKRLQEGQGRWLKLISGLAIIAIGLLMLLKPDWLM